MNRRLRIVFVLNLALVASGLLPVSVHAATFVVSKVADTNDGVCDADCSLREAVAAANAALTDDTINFDPSVFSVPRTILAGIGVMQINNAGALEIHGPGRDLLTWDAGDANRLLSIVGATVAIDSLKMTRGNGRGGSFTLDGGAIYKSGGALTINNVIISNCVATGGGGRGGAIYNEGSLTINNSSITNNQTFNAQFQQAGPGGAIYNATNSSINVTGSTISNNSAGDSPGEGGALYNAASVTTMISNSTVASNFSSNGGAILNTNGSLSISGTTFSNNLTITNTQFYRGGAIRHNGGTFFISGCTFNGNSSANGGGLSIDAGNGTIEDSLFQSNTAANGNGNGGGLFITNAVSASADVVNCDFIQNSANLYGGGIANYGTLNAFNVRIINNQAHLGGGVASNRGTVTIASSLISGNTGSNAGGICNGCNEDTSSPTPTMNVVNTTVSDNTATTSGAGGGFQNGNFCSLNFSASTVSSNTAIRGGGGQSHSLGTVRAINTIIGDNIATGGIGPDMEGALTSQGYILIENTSGVTISGVTTGNIIGRDPQLVVLRNNGGRSNSVALQPNSPAIDAGDPNIFPATDQRGVSRPQDGNLDGEARPDIGAYERQITPFLVTKIADTSDGTCDADCSLREAIVATNSATTPDNGVVFASGIFGTPQTITLTLGELTISNPPTLFIKGPGSDLLTISGNNQSRVFSARSGSYAGVSALKITGGNGGGGVNSGFGGAVYTDAAGFGISACLITGNSAMYGGAVANFVGTLFVSDSNIDVNTTINDAGAVHNEPIGNLIMVRSSASSNSGPGLGNYGNLMITDSQFNNNSNGGIHNWGTWAVGTISNTTIDSNRAFPPSANGAGISNSGNLTLASSTISRNVTSSGSGGGVWNFGTMTINNSTVSGNSAGHAGGIDNSSGTATLNYVTVARNASTLGMDPGGIKNSGALNSRDSIIADNFSSFSAVDLQGTLASQGYNLIGNTTGSTITGTTTGNLLNVNPRLDPILRLNGGATQTHSLRRGSPAVDKGANVAGVTSDQRSLTRPVDFPSIPNASGGNGSDIGAFERQLNDIVRTSVPFDFDGDGKSDLSIFRPSVGEWYYHQSSTNVTRGFGFGTSTDKPVPADFTGDGKADIAFWRPSTGDWFVLRSEDSTYFAFPFGASGDIPAPADFDGDGKADPAVFRPSAVTWFILRSSNGGVDSVPFGISTDVPEPADYDGDGKADVGIYRPAEGQWWNLRSSNGSVYAATFGSPADKPVPGDYTGDGKSDIAFYRPSEGSWYIVRSEDQSFYAFPFGNSADKPAPADFDGDGKYDAAVFRPSDTNWYILKSTGGVQIQQFGAANDIPLPGANVP